MTTPLSTLVEEVWFVAYEGTEPSDARALVAAETDPGAFTGFWTYENETVAAIIERLDAAHPPSKGVGTPADD